MNPEEAAHPDMSDEDIAWLRTVGENLARELVSPQEVDDGLRQITDPANRPPIRPLPTARRPIRVLIADGHALLRRRFDFALRMEADIEVVGTARDGSEAVAKASELLPDVALLGLEMPRRGGIGRGIEAAAAIKEVAPSTRIVMLTMSDEEADLYEAIKAGATGYVLRKIPPHEIGDSIRAVAGGQSLITPSMATKLLSEFATMAHHGEEHREQGPPAPKLTDRELEVLKLIATGANNSKIAKTLFISENTVKNHVRNILEKLQLHSRMEAVMYAVREKILGDTLRPSPRTRG